MSGKDESTGDKVLKTSASISNLLSNAFTKQMSISSQQMSSPSSQEQSPFLLSSPSSKMEDPKLWRAELPNSPFTISLGDKQINTGSIELLNLLWNDLNGKTPEEKRQIKACFEAKTTNEEILFKSYISSLSQFLQRYDNEKEGTKKEVVPRDLRHKDWSNIVGCSHSTDGSVGVTFIECTQPPKTNTLSIGKPPPSGHTIYRENIVAKPCEPEEFAKQKFLNTLAQYCKIKVPNVRAISNAAEGDKIERDSLKANIEKLYVEPFHHGIYEGPRSPRDLFLKPLIMLMDLALGKSLDHSHFNKQSRDCKRILNSKDFQSLGSLFVFDLLVRNVDRLPCRKTLSRATGNAGNIMFSDQIKEAGQLWAIDNDIRLTESVDSEKIQINTSQQEIELRENKESYVVNFKSVVSEILEKKQERYIFRQINHLIFDEIPEFFGILPASLNTIWSLSCNETDSVFQYCKDKYPCVETAIDTLLQMIRHRYQADPFNLVYEKLSVPSLLPTNRNHTQAVFLRGCEWSKHPGDDVVAGEVIVTIKIDEVVNPIEIRALKAGKIVKTLATAKNQFTLGYEELYAIDYHPPPPLQRKIMKEKLMANLIGAKFRACKWAKMTGDTVCENDLIVTIEIEGVAKSIEVRSKYAGILLYCESRIVSGGKIEAGTIGSLYEILQLYNSKTLWAEWIRLSAARAVTDIRDFVEKSTNTTTTGFDESFLAGFVETAEEVVEKKNEILSGLRATDAGLQHVSPRENERDTIVEKQARGTELIGKLIDILAEELMRVNRMKSKWAQLRVLALDKKAKKFAILQSSLVPSTATATSTATTTILRKEEKL